MAVCSTNVANLRCGAWYVQPEFVSSTLSIVTSIVMTLSKVQKEPVYFKSTDGHFGKWAFNLRRANLHLLDAIMQCEGCVSTIILLNYIWPTHRTMQDNFGGFNSSWKAISRRFVKDCSHLVRGHKLGSRKKVKGALMDHHGVESALRFIHPPWEWYASQSLFSTPAYNLFKVSRSEHAQIQSRLDDWTEQLMV